MIGKQGLRAVRLGELLDILHIGGPSVYGRYHGITVSGPLQVNGIATAPFPGIVQIEDSCHITFTQFIHEIIQSGQDSIIIDARCHLQRGLYPRLYAIFTVSTHQYAQVVDANTFQKVQLLMQPFTIAAFTFGTKNGTIPEIGTYKIIGFSVANELSIGIDLNKRMLRRLRGTCSQKE